MLEDVQPFSVLWERLAAHKQTLQTRSVGALVAYIEKKLGLTFFLRTPGGELGNKDLLDLYALAKKLERFGLLAGLNQAHAYPDEPPLHAWIANVRRASPLPGNASGAHHTDERAALTSTLAEVVERHLWFETTDYFDTPTIATTGAIAARGNYIDPNAVTGFSLRDTHQSTTNYHWVRGYSWTTQAPLWVPSQLISGDRSFFEDLEKRKEPLMRGITTNGLATRQTREGAVLYGALELIERDAFMIMWLNQLTLPRFDLDDLCAENESLNELVASCTKYGLRVDVVRMLTDAPTYAVCAVVTDERGYEPKTILGLRAHPNKYKAAEKALLEALRIRQMTRHMLAHPPHEWSEDTKARDIGHTDRLLYWATKGRSERLAFLTKGPIQRFDEPWEHDSEQEHLGRIVSWCKEVGYELASVSMTKSKKNVSPWQIEMVVIPELQPIYLNEQLRHTTGARLKSVPALFDYTHREPYVDDPHPFA